MSKRKNKDLIVTIAYAPSRSEEMHLAKAYEKVISLYPKETSEMEAIQSEQKLKILNKE